MYWWAKNQQTQESLVRVWVVWRSTPKINLAALAHVSPNLHVCDGHWFRFGSQPLCVFALRAPLTTWPRTRLWQIEPIVSLLKSKRRALILATRLRILHPNATWVRAENDSKKSTRCRGDKSVTRTKEKMRRAHQTRNVSFIHNKWILFTEYKLSERALGGKAMRTSAFLSRERINK